MGIIKQSNNYNKMSKDKKYFRLIHKSVLPNLIPSQQQKDPTKATISLIKKRKFIYLDMNTTNGFKAMQNVETESDDDDEKFGSFIVCQGSKTSRQKIKLKQFMTINYNTRQKRNLLRTKVKQELDKSKDKSRTLQLKSLQKSNLRLHRGIDPEIFQTLKHKIQTEEMNSNILKKEEKMMQKLGIVSDFQSIKDRTTPSFLQKSKKAEGYFLPKILKSYVHS